MPEANRRRSERILLTIPIRVDGKDSEGKVFSERTRTLVINRHGARIQLKHSISSGTALKITNVMADLDAPFRAVGPTQTVKGESGEWGVECTDGNKNIWGIDFPPMQEDPSSSSALLECRTCHSLTLMQLSLVELDVLSASGVLTKECKNCKVTTTWVASEKLAGAPPPSPAPQPAAREVAGKRGPTTERRKHRRAALRLPIRLRNAQGVIELAKSENICKGGLAFVSQKEYKVGEMLQVTCPFDPAGQSIELPARVVRSAEMKGTGRKIYGLCYTQESE